MIERQTILKFFDTTQNLLKKPALIFLYLGAGDHGVN